MAGAEELNDWGTIKGGEGGSDRQYFQLDLNHLIMNKHKLSNLHTDYYGVDKYRNEYEQAEEDVVNREQLLPVRPQRPKRSSIVII